jgi:hypothetical protein
MCRISNSILAVVGVGVVSGAAVMSRSPSIEGVWRPAEVTIPGPEARRISQLQANLDIITAKHYSRVEIHTEGSRPGLADAATATADELRRVWGPVVAEAGSYEKSGGNTLTFHPVVAKNPSAMTPGSFATYAYRVTGDTLWLTQQRDQRGPVSNPPTIKLVRVE